MSAGFPEGLTVERDRDLAGRGGHVWVRRAGLLVLCAFIAAALLNVFGQHQETSVAQGAGTRLTVEAPHALRGGDIVQLHLTISTTPGIANLRLHFSQSFLDGFTFNTVTPDASNQAGINGPVALEYGRLDSGNRMEIYIEGQVNPNTVGRRHWDIDIYDGTKRLTGFHRTMTVFP
ncbi:MAG: hypothetical protein QOH62_156 [Solirubrobacteraceae bacterium]|jgi:hypothetical protein|nr:hypothetical protein [Solirubrobacteraceae bacterium]